MVVHYLPELCLLGKAVCNPCSALEHTQRAAEKQLAAALLLLGKLSQMGPKRCEAGATYLQSMI